MIELGHRSPQGLVVAAADQIDHAARRGVGAAEPRSAYQRLLPLHQQVGAVLEPRPGIAVAQQLERAVHPVPADLIRIVIDEPVAVRAELLPQLLGETGVVGVDVLAHGPAGPDRAARDQDEARGAHQNGVIE
ncbi:hypothetical protein [Methylocaldum marinum]|uniref:hypothetical protein n=1 Tax=Methylocaldum marinum TaxID=1432792 RepID=UPI001474E748|nr:hypothetical protein [Methylocaldum marinum]